MKSRKAKFLDRNCRATLQEIGLTRREANTFLVGAEMAARATTGRNDDLISCAVSNLLADNLAIDRIMDRAGVGLRRGELLGFVPPPSASLPKSSLRQMMQCEVLKHGGRVLHVTLELPSRKRDEDRSDDNDS